MTSTSNTPSSRCAVAAAAGCWRRAASGSGADRSTNTAPGCDDDDGRDRGECPAGPPWQPRERAVEDRLLDVAVGDDRHRERDAHAEREQRPAGETGSVRGEPEIDGPVVQVEPVGDATDLGQRPGREHRPHRTDVGEDGEDRRAREQREREEPAAVELDVQQRRRRSPPQERGEPHAAHHREEPADERGEVATRVGEHRRQRPTDQQLADPRVGAVVEAVEPGATVLEHEHPHRGREGRAAEQRRDHERRAPAAHQEQEADREEHVRLLLDGERPEVLRGRGGREQVEVRPSARDEVPVGGPGGRRQHVARQRVRLLAHRDGGAEQDDAGEREEGGRHQTAGAPAPERAQAAAAADRVAEQDSGDEESREREEEGHAEEAAARPGDLAVVEEDQQDGDRTQPVEARVVPAQRGGALVRAAVGGPRVPTLARSRVFHRGIRPSVADRARRSLERPDRTVGPLHRGPGWARR